MKICLINPPLTLSRNQEEMQMITPPLGLAYVAASVENDGNEVKIIDSVGEKWDKVNTDDSPSFAETRKYLGMSQDEIIKAVKSFSPDVVGITGLTPDGWMDKRILTGVKEEFGNSVTTVIGGPHATVRSEYCSNFADFVVVREGDYALLEIIKQLEGSRNFDKVNGIVFKKDGKTVFTDERPLDINLDLLPLPARHLLPIKDYFRHSKKYKTAGSYKWTTMITSRGCPFNCKFCSVFLTVGRVFRPRSPENVVAEIEHLIDTYGVEEFSIQDDNFTLDIKRAEKICDLIIEKKLDIDFLAPNGVRADMLDENLLRKMKQAGCTEIALAPESGDQEILKQIFTKNLDLKKVEDAARLCKKIGITVSAYFVLGMIGEKKENIRKTLDFAYKIRELGVRWCQFNIAAPLYGTRLYEEAKQNGYLIKEEGEEFEYNLLNGDPLIKTPYLTPKELHEFRIQAIKEQSSQMMFKREVMAGRIKKFSKMIVINPTFTTRLTVDFIKRILYNIETLSKNKKRISG